MIDSWSRAVLHKFQYCICGILGAGGGNRLTFNNGKAVAFAAYFQMPTKLFPGADTAPTPNKTATRKTKSIFVCKRCQAFTQQFRTPVNADRCDRRKPGQWNCATLVSIGHIVSALVMKRSCFLSLTWASS